MSSITQSDYLAMLRRTTKELDAQTTAIPGGQEAKLHQAIWKECASRGWICLHGAMNKRTHRTKGEPDFIILADNGRQWHIECKTKDGKLSIDQQSMKVHYRSLGHTYHVVRSVSEFLKLINQ